MTGLSQRIAHLHPNLQGAVWIALAGFVLTLMTATIKFTGAAIPVVQILFIRQVVMGLSMAPHLLRNPRGTLVTSVPGLHLLRIALSSLAMVCGFTAMVHLPLADGIAISFSRSFFVAIFAIVILHEIVRLHRWIGIAAGFAGVVVITDPGGTLNLYTVLALISAGAVALIMVLVRKLSRSESLQTVITYQALGVGAVLALPAFLAWVPPTPLQWVLMLAIGTLSTLGQSLNFMAFRVGEATALAPVDYLRLIHSLLIGAIFFTETPTLTTMVGAALLIASSGWALWGDRRAATPHPS